MPNETDPVALAREALETYKVDEWPTMCALARAVLDKDAQFKEHTKAVAQFLSDMHCTMIDPLAEGKIKIAEECALLLAAAVEQRQRDSDKDARIKELETVLADVRNLADKHRPSDDHICPEEILDLINQHNVERKK